MDSILIKPHVISIGDRPYTLLQLQQELQQRAVRYTQDVEKLLEIVTETPSVSQQFVLECRTGHDYGYHTEPNRPTLQTMVRNAREEGLVLCPHEVPIHLMFRRPCPIKESHALLFVTQEVIIERRPHLPLLQGIARPEGEVTGYIRMVTGDLLVEWSLNTVMVFCRPLK